MATHTVEHADEQIDQIVDGAVREMSSRVARFEAEVKSAASGSEIEALRQAAQSEVHEIWSSAKTEVEQTAKGYKDELSDEVAAASRTLVEVRNDAKNQIGAAAAAAEESLSATTTTTTTPPNTTTTQPGVTTTQPDVTTTTQGGGIPPGSEPTPPSQQTPLEAWAAQAFVSGLPEAADDTTTTPSGIVVALDSVLPRDLVDWAMSPFRILQVIVRTTVQGGRDVLYPAAALVLSVIALGVIEARFRRRASSRRIVSTG